MASGDENGNVVVWNIRYGTTAKKVKNLKIGNSPICKMTFSNAVSKERNQDIVLVTCSNECAVDVWNIQQTLRETESKHMLGMNSADMYLLKQFRTKNTPVISVEFTKRNLLVAGGIYTPLD